MTDAQDSSSPSILRRIDRLKQLGVPATTGALFSLGGGACPCCGGSVCWLRTLSFAAAAALLSMGGRILRRLRAASANRSD